MVTAAVVIFVWQARPEILEKAYTGQAVGSVSLKKVLAGLAVAVVVVGGTLSWFASSHPDGLEWSLQRTLGTAELEAPAGVHQALAELQSKTAFMPDYGFKSAEEVKIIS